MNKIENTSSPHRFFHSMVVMGGALAAAHCGGATDGQPDGDGDSDEGAGGNSTLETGGGGTAMQATGGATFTSAGGLTVIPDIIDDDLDDLDVPDIPFPLAGLGLGGAGSEDQCPLAQWDCGAVDIQCAYDGYTFNDEFSATCGCDRTRPTAESDCDPGEEFVCRSFSENEEGERFNSAEPFECSCQPAELYCDDQCGNIDPAWPADGYDCKERDTSTILCGCGWILLK